MRGAADRPDHTEQLGIALSQSSVTAATASTVTLYSTNGLIAVKEELDGAVADVPQVVSSSAGDDDLTSLTWLQDKNLLKSVSELPKHEFAEGSTDSLPSSTLSSSTSAQNSPSSSVGAVSRVSYDPHVHVNSKPPFSFSCLIFMAIEDSDEKALPVKDIYVWILDHFPYYRNAPTGWKNSVRHNLSLNKCFKKVDKAPNLGKGSLWMVEQRFRPCLIQALQKTPYNQYHKFIRNSNNINNNTVNKQLSDNKIGVEEFDQCCNSNKIIKMASETEITSCDLKMNVKSKSKEVNDDQHLSLSSHDSRLFSVKDSMVDDVDAAATAMLVLKHGACALDIKTENIDFVLQGNSLVPKINDEAAEGKSNLANCSNDDHNYGYHYTTARIDSLVNDKLDSEFWNSSKEDPEERRKIVEGADALLNLAGITTYSSCKRSPSADEQCNLKQSIMESLIEPRSKHSRKAKTLVNYRESSSTQSDERGACNDVDENSDSDRCISVISSSKEDKVRMKKSNNNFRKLRKKFDVKRTKL